MLNLVFLLNIKIITLKTNKLCLKNIDKKLNHESKSILMHNRDYINYHINLYE